MAALAAATPCAAAAANRSVVSCSYSNSNVGVAALPLRRLRGRPQPASRYLRRAFRGPSALFDRGPGGGDSSGKKDDKKFITKEEEPEQYWQTSDERDGKNPMATPLPYIVILGVLSPFLILAVAFANNWIKIPVR